MTLVAFDFDGTLSDDEMIVRLAEEAGVAAEVEAVTERAMAGELGYAESLRERAALLEGLRTEAVERAFGRVGLRRDAPGVLAALDEAGVPTAVLTGGFEAGVEAALARAGVRVDRVVANRLPAVDGELTGAVEGPLVEGTKDDALGSVAAEFGVPMAATVAVGDGANDVPMLRAAGTAIGFRPKPATRPHCDVVVATMGRLRRVLTERGVLPGTDR